MDRPARDLWFVLQYMGFEISPEMNRMARAEWELAGGRVENQDAAEVERRLRVLAPDVVKFGEMMEQVDRAAESPSGKRADRMVRRALSKNGLIDALS